MIPFVVAGGILLAAAVMLSGKGAVPEAGSFLNDLFMIGVTGFQLMVPILAAYIGYSIADRSALAPCAIAAMIGTNMYNTGFFGAIFAGLLGGIVVYYLKKIKVPDFARSVMPIFVIPIVGIFITVGAMVWGIGEPVGLPTFMNKKLYDDSEREAGRAAILMGTMGITEGAIPFAAADPLRVIPAIMLGAAAGSVTAAVLQVETYAAWGGLIVLPVVEGRFGFVVALAIGSVVTALLVNFMKARRKVTATESVEDDFDMEITIG